LRDPLQRNFTGLMPVLGALIGLAVGHAALADPDESDASPATPVSEPDAVAASLTGPEVYNEICVACHAPPGVGGAPALGDGDAWAARIGQGMDTLIDHALHGYSGGSGIMPKKGGRLDLADEEIIGAVEYMVDQAVEKKAP